MPYYVFSTLLFFSPNERKLTIHLNANLRCFSFSHGLAVSGKLIIQMRLAAPVEGGKGGSVRFGGDPGTTLSRAVLTPPLGRALTLSFLPAVLRNRRLIFKKCGRNLNVVAPAAWLLRFAPQSTFLIPGDFIALITHAVNPSGCRQTFRAHQARPH